MKVTLELKKTILRVLQETGRRPLSPEALATYANAQMDAPVTAEQVRAALAELEQLGMVRRQASVLDPTGGSRTSRVRSTVWRTRSSTSSTSC